MMIKYRWSVWSATAFLLLTGCGLVGESSESNFIVTESITVTSPSFRDDGPMPVRYACARYGGQGKTPALRWSGLAADVRSFALVVDDPDAPSGAYVHWVLFNLDATASELLEGTTPQSARQAQNTSGRTGYTPPCPPQGEQHRYRFTVYGLRETVPLGNGAPLRDALAAIADRTVSRGRLTGRVGAGESS